MVVKYPSNDVEGPPYLLLPARTIKAHSIGIEVPFYEDENGVIQNGREIDPSAGSGPTKRSLLIQPDVTFFDADRNPILFIELVATHKPDVEKLLKIRKLGIDTVQVCIPKDKEEEIRKIFSHVERTKWVFNYEQEKTEYVRPAVANTAGIPPLDDFQTTLLEGIETIDCKTFAVNEFIRRIRKIMASTEFREFEEGIVEEIRYVEVSTARAQNEWAELQDKIHRDIREGIAEEERRLGREEQELRREMELLESAESEFGGIKREFAKESADLERQYISDRESLERAQSEYRSAYQNEIDGIERDLLAAGSEPRTHQERIERIRREEENWDRNYKDTISRIAEDTGRAREDVERYEIEGCELSAKYEQLEEELRREFEGKGRSLEAEFERRKRELREEFERTGRESLAAIAAKDSGRVSRVSGRLKLIFESRERLLDISKAAVNLRRLYEVRKFFREGDIKGWPKL